MSSKTTKIVFASLIACIALLAVYSVLRISALKNKVKDLRHNVTALSDTLYEFRSTNGQLVQWNNALIVDKDRLADELEDEQMSKREIERELNAKIAALTKLKAQIRYDTIRLTDTVQVLADSVVLAPIRYTDEWLTLQGSTKIKGGLSETTIGELSVNAPLTIGVSKDNQVFVTSANPYLRVEALNSYTLPKTKQRRVGLGLYCGFGVQYGILTKKIDIGPQMGIGMYVRLL